MVLPDSIQQHQQVEDALHQQLLAVGQSGGSIRLTLELTGAAVPQSSLSSNSTLTTSCSSLGSSSCGGGGVDFFRPSVKKVLVEHEDAVHPQTGATITNVALKLLVTLQLKTIDASAANQLADLLLDEIDRLPADNVILEAVLLCNLKLTPEGAAGLKLFLSIHATQIKHVAVRELLLTTSRTLQQDEEAFLILTSAFESSLLVTVDLSHNVLNANLWKSPHNNRWLTSQRELQQFILDRVKMDAASLQALEPIFVSTFSHSLEDLHVVLSNPANLKPMNRNSAAVTAANNMIASCTKLYSLRWACLTPASDTALPWQGLSRMAVTVHANLARDRQENHSLTHVVFEGCGKPLTTAESECLQTAVAHLSQLKTLKLRRVGLTCDLLRTCLSPALTAPNSRPALEVLDISFNQIKAAGIMSLTDALCSIGKCKRHFKTLAVTDNHISTDAAKYIIEKLGACCHQVNNNSNTNTFDLKLDGNPINFGKVALSLAVLANKNAAAAAAAESNNNNNHDASTSSHQTAVSTLSQDSQLSALVQQLQAENNRLRKERDALKDAFAVLGANSKQDNQEKRMLLDRIAKLEDMVIQLASSGSSSSSHNHNSNNNNNSQSSHASAQSHPGLPPSPSTSFTTPVRTISSERRVAGNARDRLSLSRLSGTSGGSVCSTGTRETACSSACYSPMTSTYVGSSSGDSTGGGGYYESEREGSDRLYGTGSRTSLDVTCRRRGSVSGGGSVTSTSSGGNNSGSNGSPVWQSQQYYASNNNNNNNNSSSSHCASVGGLRPPSPNVAVNSPGYVKIVTDAYHHGPTPGGGSHPPSLPMRQSSSEGWEPIKAYSNHGNASCNNSSSNSNNYSLSASLHSKPVRRRSSMASSSCSANNMQQPPLDQVIEVDMSSRCDDDTNENNSASNLDVSYSHLGALRRPASNSKF